MKILLFTLLLFSGFSGAAQGDFNVLNFKLGGALTTGNLKSYGIGVSWQPYWYPNENKKVGIGLNFDANLFNKGSFDTPIGAIALERGNRGAIGGSFQYAFVSGDNRPYVAVNPSLLITTARWQNMNPNVEMLAANTFGIGLELGFVFNRYFVISATYYLAPLEHTLEVSDSPDTYHVPVNPGYFTLRIGASGIPIFRR